MTVTATPLRHAARRLMTALALVLVAGHALAASPLVSDVTDSRGTRHLATQADVLYDDYFHTATFALGATVSPTGQVSWQLLVTWHDAPVTHFEQGDTMTVTLRGGRQLTLTTVQPTTRADVSRHHHAGHRNVWQVTCHYGLTPTQIHDLATTRPTRVTLHLGDGRTVGHRVDGLQTRVARLFSQLHEHLGLPRQP